MNFTMCAFTKTGNRFFKAMGTKGDITADMSSNKIRIRLFDQPEEEVVDVALMQDDFQGHGGGDSCIIADFLDMLINETEATERTTTLPNSMESHFLCLAIEESRKNGGKVVEMDKFRNRK